MIINCNCFSPNKLDNSVLKKTSEVFFKMEKWKIIVDDRSANRENKWQL